jgi:hypothetical protein
MAALFNFWLIKMPSHAMRGEVLNVGLLLEQDGHFLVRAGKRLEKIRSISAAIDAGQIQDELNALAIALSDCKAADVEHRVASFSFLKCHFQGSFDPGSVGLSEHYIADLLDRYVDPEPAPLKPVKKRHTRLRQEMVRAFRLERVLAKPSEGLESHRIIYRHRLAEGVEADFVLKNGAFHVVESVDASSDEVTLQRSLYEIAMSTLTFEHAKIGFGNNSVRSRLVYQASASLEKALTPSLYAAEHQGAEVINWKSGEARSRFIENLAKIAESTDPMRNVETLFHASALPRERIN